MQTVTFTDLFAAAMDARDANTYEPPYRPRALYKCCDCGKRFRTHEDNCEAIVDGCPRCGGSDIDRA